jgi:cytochrome P450
MEQRKLMLPAFHGELMENLRGLIEEVAVREVSDWPRDEAFEVHPRMQSLTLEIILRAVFGLDPGPRLERLRDLLSEMLEFGDRPVSLLAPPADSAAARVLERVGPFAAFVRLQTQADALIFELIDERRDDASGRQDVLAMLLEARHEEGSPMSADELRDELMTLLVAGHETTASSLAWAFERITREPDVLATLRAELEAGEDDAYLTATIQETMRSRPVLPNAAPRLTKRPVEVGGWLYPEGVCLVPNGYLLHHDADVYPDPYSFRPERFLDSPPGTYTWIPFGGGRRRCLGSSFAMLEMKVVLPAVLRAYDVTAASALHEPPQSRNITIRPAAGSRVALEPRTTRVPLAA